MSEVRHITLPAGFLAGAVAAGIKSKGEDVALIAAEAGAVPAAVLTTSNQVIGAPVAWCRKVLPQGYGMIRAIAVNSGCSNVCNGPAGDKDAAAMAAMAAEAIGCNPDQVLICSTGVIGHRMPMGKLRDGIARAGQSLGTDNDPAVARAIMTTDLTPKSAVATTTIDRRKITLAGIAKGSGMIAPSLATMLAYVTTDAAVSPAALHRALKRATEPTFNAVTVDSDTSTSDTLAVLASGAAGNPRITSGKSLDKLTAALTDVMTPLAEAIARDGEGATKLVRITVSKAASEADAAVMARSIANSPLVKTAIHGGDPNWGRILMAAGKSPGRIDQTRATCKIGGVAVMRNGTSCAYDQTAAETHLAGTDIEIELVLNLGRGRYTALTCDLSREYITINADYHT